MLNLTNKFIRLRVFKKRSSSRKNLEKDLLEWNLVMSQIQIIADLGLGLAGVEYGYKSDPNRSLRHALQQSESHLQIHRRTTR